MKVFKSAFLLLHRFYNPFRIFLICPKKPLRTYLSQQIRFVEICPRPRPEDEFRVNHFFLNLFSDIYVVDNFFGQIRNSLLNGTPKTNLLFIKVNSLIHSHNYFSYLSFILIRITLNVRF